MSLSAHLEELKKKITGLDDNISVLQRSPSACNLELQALKKRRLQLKDQMQSHAT